MTKQISITIRCDQDFKDKLQQVAKEKDIPVSQIIRDAVREYFYNHK